MIRPLFALLACLLVACAADIDVDVAAVQQSISVEDVADLPPCSLLAVPEGELAVTGVADSGGLAAVSVDGLLFCVDDIENLGAAGYINVPNLDLDVAVTVDDPSGAVADGTPLPANDHADGTPLPAHGPGTPVDEVQTVTVIDTATTRGLVSR